MHTEIIKGTMAFLAATGKTAPTRLNNTFIDQYNALDEEIKELSKSINDHDFIEFLDGIGDCLFICVSLDQLLDTQHITVPNASKKYLDAMDTINTLISTGLSSFSLTKGLTQTHIQNLVLAVIKSNLSKFDDSLEEAKVTKAYYESLGIVCNVYHPEGTDKYSVISSSELQTDINGKFYFPNKILKSAVHYKEPTQDLETIAEDIKKFNGL